MCFLFILSTPCIKSPLYLSYVLLVLNMSFSLLWIFPVYLYYCYFVYMVINVQRLHVDLLLCLVSALVLQYLTWLPIRPIKTNTAVDATKIVLAGRYSNEFPLVLCIKPSFCTHIGKHVLLEFFSLPVMGGLHIFLHEFVFLIS